MLSEIGSIAIVISLVAAIFNIFLPSLVKLVAGNNKADLVIFSNFFCQFFFNILAFLALLIGFLKDDFSIVSVYMNSSKIQPLIFKISALWGGHQGSLLLWEVLHSVFSLLYFMRLNKSSRWRFDFLYFQSLISACFLLFIYLQSNPFTKIIPIPNDGIGLNPILQDIALAIHPPILFAAYALFSIVYSLTISSLKNRINLFKELQQIVPLSFGVLTIAISLGSWWAYRELGWGGFWFWDPVENTSLLPWLVSLALIHMIKNASKGININAVYILSVVTFISCLLATFLVRSGMLTSVHSFVADKAVGLYILCYITIFLLLALFYLIRNDQQDSKLLAKGLFEYSTLLITNMIILITFYFAVAIGTLFPLLYELINSEKITIGENYYNNVGAVLSVLALLFMLFSNYLGRNRKIYIATQNYKSNIKYNILLSMLIALIVEQFSNNLFGNLIFISRVLLILCFGYIISQLMMIIEILRKRDLGLLKKQKNMHLGHLGFALLVIAIIVVNGQGFVDESKIKIGETKSYNNDFHLTLDDIKRASIENYKKVTAEISVRNSQGELLGSLQPQVRFYPERDIRTNEVAILHISYLNDLYSTIEKLEDGEYVYLRLQYKPLMGLIWLSVILIAFSALYRK